MTNTPLTYKDAGVDIERGEALVEKIKSKVQSTYGDRVISGVGGFACLYEIDDNRMLAAGTDGVGTKLMVAQRLGVHNTIGIDLVAMCANDVLCTGAKGLFFMDYLATGKLELGVAEQIIDGIVEGCRQAQLALIGGETAEMPGMYTPGKYDLAGFAVGEVFRDTLLDGSQIKPGDALVGIASSGIHSNGLSLARRLEHLGADDNEYLNDLLRPTKIYTREITLLQNQNLVHGLAHVTGGGLTNVSRMSKSVNYVIDSFPGLNEVAPVFSTITTRSGLESKELFRTFNMGVGMVVATPKPIEACKILSDLGVRSWRIGEITEGNGELKFVQNGDEIDLGVE
jgi:phosphoribosylformylglycinamidine cyclo-ligase